MKIDHLTEKVQDEANAKIARLEQFASKIEDNLSLEGRLIADTSNDPVYLDNPNLRERIENRSITEGDYKKALYGFEFNNQESKRRIPRTDAAQVACDIVDTYLQTEAQSMEIKSPIHLINYFRSFDIETGEKVSHNRGTGSVIAKNKFYPARSEDPTLTFEEFIEGLVGTEKMTEVLESPAYTRNLLEEAANTFIEKRPLNNQNKPATFGGFLKNYDAEADEMLNSGGNKGSYRFLVANNYRLFREDNPGSNLMDWAKSSISPEVYSQLEAAQKRD